MSSSAAFSPDHHHEKICYVHCNVCNTVLAVSVPSKSLFKTVTVRCGHCRNLLSVDMRSLLFPASAAAVAANAAANQRHNFFSPQNIMEAMGNAPSNLFINHQNPNEPTTPVQKDELPNTGRTRNFAPKSNDNDSTVTDDERTSEE